MNLSKLKCRQNGARDPPVKVTADEHPRPGTTLAKLSDLSTLFEDGVVTAGNASGINDGAVALLLGNEDIGKKLGLTPRARILSGAIAGVEPRVMGVGPRSSVAKSPATRRPVAGRYGRDRDQRSLCYPGAGLSETPAGGFSGRTGQSERRAPSVSAIRLEASRGAA